MSSLNPFLPDIGGHENTIGLKCHVPGPVRSRPEAFTGTFKNEIILETHDRKGETVSKEQFCHPQTMSGQKTGNAYNEIVIYGIKYSLSEIFYK